MLKKDSRPLAQKKSWDLACAILICKVKKLMKFVEWAEKRGGDAFFVDCHERPIDELTEEEKEMKKPFYARTYYVG